MKLIALTLFALFMAIATAMAAEEKWRYEMVVAPIGRAGVFRLDKETGLVVFCYYWTETGANGGQAPAGVVCTPPAK